VTLLSLFQAFVFVCFWYQLFCGFSGTVMIDQMYLMLYNFLFTSLPPMAIGESA
jgi:phospholipid-translocating ATPase